MIDASTDKTPYSFKRGYAIIPFHQPTKPLFERLDAFFRREAEYKSRYHFPSENELRYRSLAGKEFFTVRNQELPEELDLFVAYAEQVHDVAMTCIDCIQREMRWESNQLKSLICPTGRLPKCEKTDSILRLFSYSAGAGTCCDPHQDLGLITIIPRSQVPGLQIYDIKGEGEWVDIERQMHEGEALVLVGETLAKISNNRYVPPTHRVLRCSGSARPSIVYHVNAKPDAELSSTLFKTKKTGKFAKPFQTNVRTFLAQEQEIRTSVNQLY